MHYYRSLQFKFVDFDQFHIGDVRLGDLYTMLPYDDRLYEAQLLGSTILDTLEGTVTENSEKDGYPILDLAGQYYWRLE